MSGFIKIDRNFFDHAMWKEKREFSRQEAWIDLIQLAQWSDKPDKVFLKDRVIICNRGQLVRSMVTLADRWGWSKSKVKRVLDVFVVREMIALESETVTSRITICNYDTYQPLRNASETQAERKQNAIETQVDTVEEVKNIRIEEGKNKKETASPSFPVELNTEEFKSKWDEYVAYRRSSKFKKLQVVSIEKQFAKFVKWGHDAAITAIDKTIEQGYQGIFEPSKSFTSQKQTRLDEISAAYYGDSAL